MRPLFLRQMAMYSSYHRDRWNQRLHYFGVPSITLGLLLLMAMVPFFEVGPYPVSLATLFAAAVMAYWLLLDLRVGLLTMAGYLPLVLVAAWLAELDPTPRWLLFAGLFVGGWIVQLVGHRIEGRRPALLTNLAQALIAPVFLTAELWFSAGRFAELQREIEERWESYRPSS